MPEYVVVQQEKTQTKTASGLYLPDSAQETSDIVTVVAVGAGVNEVKVGDRVIYQNRHEVTPVKVGKEVYSLVFHRNIIATVK